MIDFIKKYKWFFIGGLFFIVVGLIIFFVMFNSSPKKTIELFINESTFMEIGECEYSDVNFESMNVDVVTVDQSGKIVAFGTGTTKVIAKNSKNRVCMTYEVKVKMSDLDVEVLKVIDRIDASDITLNVGDIKNIEYSIEPSDADERLYFISENENIVAVSSAGEIRAVSSGSAIVTIINESGSVSKNILVTVNEVSDSTNENDNNEESKKEEAKKEENVRSLKILESLIFIEKGNVHQINYNVEGIDLKELKWKSSDSKVVMVSDGAVTAVGVGKAVVTVSGPKISSSVIVNVVDNSVIRSINISESSVNLSVGSNYYFKTVITPEHLSNEIVTWSSSNKEIASVDNGTVTAHKVGKTVITVKTSNDKKDTVTVNVISDIIPIESISLNGEPTLLVGESTNFTYKINPSNATNSVVSWSSSNNSVATVSQTGKVSGVGVGEATITVTTENGKSAQKVIKVQKNRRITSNDFLSTDGSVIKKKSGETIVLRGINLGLWLSRSYWGLNLNSTNNRNDNTRYSDVNNIQMNYELHNNVNIQNYAKQNGKSVNEVVNELNEIFYDNFITAYDLDVVADMGANVVRVPLEWSYFVDVDFNGNNLNYEWAFNATPFFEKRMKRLDWLVEECSKRGIYVIFDIHVAEGGLNVGGYRSNPKFFTAEGTNYRANAIKLWKYIASRYANNPAIAGYDLVNEPGTIGETVTTNHIREFYSKAYDEIRKDDPKHIIIMEMPFVKGHDSVATLGAPDTSWINVVYSLHDYIWINEGSEMSKKIQYSSYDEMKRLFDQKLKETTAFMKEHQIPIFIGEFSGMRPYKVDNKDIYIWDYMMDSYDKNNINYAAWTYKAAYFDYMSLVYMTPTNSRVKLQYDSYDKIKELFSQNSQNSVFKIGDGETEILRSGVSLKNEPYYNILRNHFNGDVGNVVWGTNSYYKCNAGTKFKATVRAISNTGKSTIQSLSTSNSSIATIVKVSSKGTQCDGISNCSVVEVSCLNTGNVDLIAKSSTGATSKANTNVTLIRFGTNSSYKCKAGEKITATIKVEGGINVQSYNSSNTNIANIIKHPSAGPTCDGCATVQIQCGSKGTTTLNAYSNVGTAANVNVIVS